MAKRMKIETHTIRGKNVALWL